MAAGFVPEPMDSGGRADFFKDFLLYIALEHAVTECTTIPGQPYLSLSLPASLARESPAGVSMACRLEGVDLGGGGSCDAPAMVRLAMAF